MGDVLDLGNGYRLRVGRDQVYGEGHGYRNGENDEKMQALAWGLGALIHFAEGQWSAAMLEFGDRAASTSDGSDLMGGTTPMLLELLRQLGVDTDREFDQIFAGGTADYAQKIKQQGRDTRLGH